MRFGQVLLSIVLCAITINLAQSQSQTGGATKDVLEQQVASDLYFIYDDIFQFSLPRHGRRSAGCGYSSTSS